MNDEMFGELVPGIKARSETCDVETTAEISALMAAVHAKIDEDAVSVVAEAKKLVSPDNHFPLDDLISAYTRLSEDASKEFETQAEAQAAFAVLVRDVASAALTVLAASAVYRVT